MSGNHKGIVADVNADGFPDVVAGVFGQNRYSVFLNNCQGGFVEHFYDAPHVWLIGRAAADFDGNGKVDIAAVSNSQASLTVFLNR